MGASRCTSISMHLAGRVVKVGKGISESKFKESGCLWPVLSETASGTSWKPSTAGSSSEEPAWSDSPNVTSSTAEDKQ